MTYGCEKELIVSHSTAECYVKDYAAYKRTEFVTVSSCNDQEGLKNGLYDMLLYGTSFKMKFSMSLSCE